MSPSKLAWVGVHDILILELDVSFVHEPYHLHALTSRDLQADYLERLQRVADRIKGFAESHQPDVILIQAWS